MNLFVKILSIILIIIGVLIDLAGILNSNNSHAQIMAVIVGSGILITLGMVIFIINRDEY